MRPSPHGVLLALTLLTAPLARAGEAGLPVATAQVSQAPSYAVLQQFAGLVESAQQSTLAFTSSAPLAAMAVDAGDQITEGQILARLDDRELAAALSSAQAAQRLAEAEHTAQRALAELAVMKAERAEALFERQQLAEQAFDDARLAAAAEQARERVAKALGAASCCPSGGGRRAAQPGRPPSALRWCRRGAARGRRRSLGPGGSGPYRSQRRGAGGAHWHAPSPAAEPQK